MPMEPADVLELVELRPTYAALDPEWALSACAEAMQVFMDYTLRDSVPDSALSAVADIACIRLSMAGAEGSSSASEGGMSRTWDALPQSLRDRMDRYRRPML